MKRLATMLSLLLALIPLWGQHADKHAGEYGFQMLKIIGSPQAAGAAGTCYLGAEDPLALLANPTSGLFTDTRGISIASESWLFDTHLTNIALTSARGRHSFGVVFRNLEYGKFEMYDDQGNNIGEYHPLDLKLMANYAVRILPDAFFGVNLGGIYEKINTASSYGFTSDLGTAWKTPVDGMTLSGSLKYLGKTSKMNTESLDLPVTGEIGLTQTYELNGTRLTGDLRSSWSVDDDAPKEAIGLTAEYHRLLTFRVGYRFNYDLEAFSAGIGLRLKKLSVDYAYLPVKLDLDDVHFVGITYHY